MKKLSFAVFLSALISTQLAAEEQHTATDQEKIKQLEQRINVLENSLDNRMNAIADEIENTRTGGKNKVHIGGYGEMQYNNLDNNGEDFRQLDFHRMVLFFGYDFNENARFVSEVEIEHVVSSAGARGAVELEQAYLEFDLRQHLQLRTGVLLMPVGIINETHEPPTYYGVERPIVETTIIPTTWYSNGVSLIGKLDNGLSWDFMISEGLKTSDPNSDPAADPFDLKAGKQKGSFAAAYDLAVTGRVTYRGISGLELSAYTQYQPDLDQSAEISYAEDATMAGAHIIYQWQQLTTKALYARWDLSGDAAEAAGKNIQDGGYLEVDWKPGSRWGLFIRQSAWSQMEGIEGTQSKFGVNYYPYNDIVFKFDLQRQNEDAGNSDGFNLGMGYQF